MQGNMWQNNLENATGKNHWMNWLLGENIIVDKTPLINHLSTGFWGSLKLFFGNETSNRFELRLTKQSWPSFLKCQTVCTSVKGNAPLVTSITNNPYKSWTTTSCDPLY
eukprot:2934563-Amphidinium_carterae.1